MKLRHIALVGVAAAISIAAAAPHAVIQHDPMARFARRIDAYVQLHRRVEGPIPPLGAANDMTDVHRLMARVRKGIIAARRAEPHEPLFDAEIVALMRLRIASCASGTEIAELDEDVRDHSPARLMPPEVLAPLPKESPFVPLPPQLLQQLPPLPPELRYVVLDRSLLVWDHHADLVVDIARGLLDPALYRQ